LKLKVIEIIQTSVTPFQFSKWGPQKIVGGIGSRSVIKHKHVKVDELVIFVQKIKVGGK
jgi:hypothetical protein